MIANQIMRVVFYLTGSPFWAVAQRGDKVLWNGEKLPSYIYTYVPPWLALRPLWQALRPLWLALGPIRLAPRPLWLALRPLQLAL